MITNYLTKSVSICVSILLNMLTKLFEYELNYYDI